MTPGVVIAEPPRSDLNLRPLQISEGSSRPPKQTPGSRQRRYSGAQSFPRNQGTSKPGRDSRLLFSSRAEAGFGPQSRSDVSTTKGRPTAVDNACPRAGVNFKSFPLNQVASTPRGDSRRFLFNASSLGFEPGPRSGVSPSEGLFRRRRPNPAVRAGGVSGRLVEPSRHHRGLRHRPARRGAVRRPGVGLGRRCQG